MQIDLEPHEYRRENETRREPIFGPNAVMFFVYFGLALLIGPFVAKAVDAGIAILWP